MGRAPSTSLSYWPHATSPPSDPPYRSVVPTVRGRGPDPEGTAGGVIGCSVPAGQCGEAERGGLVPEGEAVALAPGLGAQLRGGAFPEGREGGRWAGRRRGGRGGRGSRQRTPRIGRTASAPAAEDAGVAPSAAVGQGAGDRVEDRREDRRDPRDQAEVGDLVHRVDMLDLEGEQDAADADVRRGCLPGQGMRAGERGRGCAPPVARAGVRWGATGLRSGEGDARVPG